jgi:MFS family permease
LVSLALFAELLPLYPIYALLITGAGVSDGRLSLLLALWSVVTFVLQLPAGALADRVSRRLVLAGAASLRGAGFAVWLLWPTFSGFAAGFVLWGVADAATSGAWEALIYEELRRIGADGRYATVAGRAEAAGAAGVLAATAVAGALVGLGGYPAAGWASVAACGVAAVLPFTLPVPAGQAGDDGSPSRDGTGEPGYGAILRAGVGQAVGDGVVRRALLASCLLTGLTAIEEYFPLLARDLDVPDAARPLLLFLPALAATVGAALSGRAARWSGARLARLVVLGAALLGGGALIGHPAGFVALGAANGMLWCVALVTSARLQDVVTGPRATVMSVSGLGAEAVALVLFAALGATVHLVPLAMAIAAVSIPLLALAALLPRWLPPPAAIADRP